MILRIYIFPVVDASLYFITNPRAMRAWISASRVIVPVRRVFPRHATICRLSVLFWTLIPLHNIGLHAAVSRRLRTVRPVLLVLLIPARLLFRLLSILFCCNWLIFRKNGATSVALTCPRQLVLLPFIMNVSRMKSPVSTIRRRS